MTLLALLISEDDSACEILGRVMPASGIAIERFSDLATAIDRIRQQKFDALIIDFEDATAAAEVFEEGRRLNSGNPLVTVALVAERRKARDILSGGAHFVLYKPLSEDNARAGLRAVTALLNRERRRAYRVPVQAPVELTLPDTRKLEGILLDLSETGMDVLTAEPQASGSLLKFRFELPDGSLEIDAHGQVAWAKPNGQTGVHFLDLDESIKAQLQAWLQAAASAQSAGEEETVPHCKLTDLSLGGCYVETDSPFPEHALVDLCLRTNEMAVHTEGMVRVTHPGYGMGVEFPSRTPEQRAQVGNLISFLRGCPESMLEMSVSPRALTADLSQFESAPGTGNELAENEDLQDPLLELLRQATTLQEDDFLEELRRQRSGETVAT
ncbi:MAG TPA: PilZ domain-containing protein [Candidatus Polarisedimenticolia bacterium]|nr:PilZ domain-containing protein [Candidatus Polarisedimenticolia bacterium]